jgi:hypothetical protein
MLEYNVKGVQIMYIKNFYRDDEIDKFFLFLKYFIKTGFILL